ncbi:MAG: hypothetical protein H7062_04240 [Candidatus Saccharimonas sp.]|nr:hypothetical protein [Planctomycetaceae bacterium]
MCVSFVKQLGVRWFVTSLTLICVVAVAMGTASAEDAALDTKSRTAGETLPPDAEALARNVARQTYLVLDTLERRHIAAPQREELLKIIVPGLFLLSDTSVTDEIAQSLAKCETADAFAELLLKRWQPMRRTPLEIERMSATIVASLESQLGHLRLMKVKEYAVEEQFRANRYVGLGVRLGTTQMIHRGTNAASYPMFSQVLPGGAAERGGVPNEAVILEVDGKSTRDVEVKTLLDWLRGPAGSEVILRITAMEIASREKLPDRDVTLTRGVIRFDSVFGMDRTPVSRGNLRFDLSEPIGCLVVQGITGSTLQELRDAEVRLRAGGIRVLVLDFQAGAQSDDFHQARLIADGLLDGGTLWHRHERDAETRAETADRECLFRGMPLVVVVGQYTGNAHAAIAAALQDAGRAVIVGQSPPFDGTVATGVPLSDEQHVLWMNTARLTRSRADRTWPLKPDHPAGPPVAMTPAEQVRLSAKPRTVMVQAAQAAQQFVRRNGTVVARDDSASALFPQNLTENENRLRLQQSAREPVFRQRQLFPASSRLPESLLPEVRRVARELLKTLPP